MALDVTFNPRIGDGSGDPDDIYNVGVNGVASGTQLDGSVGSGNEAPLAAGANAIPADDSITLADINNTIGLLQVEGASLLKYWAIKDLPHMSDTPLPHPPLPDVPSILGQDQKILFNSFNELGAQPVTLLKIIEQIRVMEGTDRNNAAYPFATIAANRRGGANVLAALRKNIHYQTGESRFFGSDISSGTYDMRESIRSIVSSAMGPFSYTRFGHNGYIGWENPFGPGPIQGDVYHRYEMFYPIFEWQLDWVSATLHFQILNALLSPGSAQVDLYFNASYDRPDYATFDAATIPYETLIGTYGVGTYAIDLTPYYTQMTDTSKYYNWFSFVERKDYNNDVSNPKQGAFLRYPGNNILPVQLELVF